MGILDYLKSKASKLGSEDVNEIALRADKPYFLAGEEVTGWCTATIANTKWILRSVMLEVVGFENVQWNSQRAEQVAGRRKYRTVLCSAESTLFESKFTLLDNRRQQQQPIRSTGQHCWPFRLALPSDLPGTFHLALSEHRANVQYKISVIANCTIGDNGPERILCHSTELTVHETAGGAILRDPINYDAKIVTGWCGLVKGRLSLCMKAAEKKLYDPGSWVKVIVEIDNESRYRIKSLVLDLLHKVQLTAEPKKQVGVCDDYQSATTVTNANDCRRLISSPQWHGDDDSESVSAVAASRESTAFCHSSETVKCRGLERYEKATGDNSREIQLRIPRDALPSCQRSALKSEWSLMLRASIGRRKGRADVEIPISVGRLKVSQAHWDKTVPPIAGLRSIDESTPPPHPMFPPPPAPPGVVSSPYAPSPPVAPVSPAVIVNVYQPPQPPPSTPLPPPLLSSPAPVSPAWCAPYGANPAASSPYEQQPSTSEHSPIYAAEALEDYLPPFSLSAPAAGLIPLPSPSAPPMIGG